MTIEEAVKMTRKLMDDNNLKNWRIVVDDAKRRIGVCKHTYKIIGLSRNLIPISKDESVLNTITHEIAHAVVGPRNGHNYIWKSKHIELGGNGERVYSDDSFVGGKNEFAQNNAPYIGCCPNGHVSYKYKRPKGKTSCGKCCSRFNPDYIIVYKENR